ncbi:hypothetical protein MFRU_003g04160 [Monilinia fructicola]|uniref:Uncharacterized protein n=1 Tax=Monilinia fructicola TaxID=38448 RepID=A0A5M9K0C9_MONFR|nr:hypothetical protein EYC84_002978 [Monilinia fructicola]KAG4034453.1 hypothetical protein MFRU_003g04160 [Monilinia fructicola]
MPPDTKTAAPKIDNNKLVWMAVAKQMDIAAEFRLIWNKIDHNRLVEDLGVGTKNAASKRFHRWIAWMVEQSAQLNGVFEDSAGATDKYGPITRFGRPLEDISESSKTGAEKKECIGIGIKMEDEDFADKKQEK